MIIIMNKTAVVLQTQYWGCNESGSYGENELIKRALLLWKKEMQPVPNV